MLLHVPWETLVVQRALEMDTLLTEKENEEDFPKCTVLISQSLSDTVSMGSLIVAERGNSYGIKVTVIMRLII